MAENNPFSKEIDFEYGVSQPISPIVRRFVAQNPGPLTFKGTNVYVLGQQEVAIIDPGPADENHIRLLLQSLQGEIITKIFVTHTHKDHSGSVEQLQKLTGAKTYGFHRGDFIRGAYQSSQTGQSDANGSLAVGFADVGFQPDCELGDGDEITGNGWSLRVLHTPGHAPDHICYSLTQENALFTGDHIMPWSTSVIAPPEGNMKDYMTSLAKLAHRPDELFLPGHGGRVRKPKRLVRAYILHRQWREKSILKAVREGRGLVAEIVPLLYRELDRDLNSAASLSVLAHLEHLVDKGQLRRDGHKGLGGRFFVVNP